MSELIPYIAKPRPDTGLTNVKLGIWLFLASEVMLFGGLFSTYILLRVGATDWPVGSTLLNVPIGTFNTAVLIGSSVTMVMAHASLKLGNFDNAVRQLERAVELRPQDPIINDHLGDSYWRVGRQREADFQWRRALSLDPKGELSAKLRLKLKQGLAEDTETTKKTPNDG